MKHSFKIPLPDYTLEAIRTLRGAGYEAYAVGGCVRDAVMGRVPHDYDITTSALPEELMRLFTEKGYPAKAVRFGTVTTVIGGSALEVTTYRTDGEYSDNRRPDSVTFISDLCADLERRDFTVNAMARGSDGELIDPFGGVRHIDERIIACVGDSEKRFTEDGLRILRALRFASELGFSVETETSRNIFKLKHLLKNLPSERIYAEFIRLICGKNAAEIIYAYSEIIKVFLPELSFLSSAELYRTARAVAFSEAEKFVRLSIFFSSLPAAHVRGALVRLKADNATIKTVTAALEIIITNAEPPKLALRRDVLKYGYETVLLAAKTGLALAQAENKDVPRRKEILSLLRKMAENGDFISLSTLEICGDDIISAGIPQGTRVGFWLKKLLYMVIEDKIENRRGVLLEYIKTHSADEI